jgi:hypothetical protein
MTFPPLPPHGNPMSDLRDRIAAAVCNWYYGEDTAWEETSEPSRQDWLGCADAVTDLLIDLAGRGELLRAIDGMHRDPADHDYRVDVTWVAPGEIAKMLGESQ